MAATARVEVATAARRRWLMLALGIAAQTAACLFVYGVPYLVPVLRGGAEHLSLARAGVVVACPTVGLLFSLVAWGALADRYGERVVLGSGLGLGAVLVLGAAAVHGAVLLGAVFVVAGAACASVFSASGRLVMGWFAVGERGLAMGLRQTSTPLGLGLAAATWPPLAAAAGTSGALLFTAGLMGLVAVLLALLLVDPPRTERPGRREPAARSGSPYRTPTLWRIHGAGALLVWPQFTAGAFGLVLLIDVRHWQSTAAGQLMAVGQLLGAGARVAAGRWSDRVRSRLRPMRQLAAATAVLMGVTALCVCRPSVLTDLALVLACGLTASTNGLSFTATAELAGPAWAGRALGVHNTGQNLTASLTPPLAGALIGATGYPWAFALAAVLAALAVVVTPGSA
ncbi:MFS transporter [Kitasatospora azatica]|uniref:MFS transporter n=1 Tax=Kitasatospora azatica TaxID=58347 RepID=UPI000565CB3C|nr:MFS transporter [Kitasatospora azatica]